MGRVSHILFLRAQSATIACAVAAFLAGYAVTTAPVRRHNAAAVRPKPRTISAQLINELGGRFLKKPGEAGSLAVPFCAPPVDIVSPTPQ